VWLRGYSFVEETMLANETPRLRVSSAANQYKIKPDWLVITLRVIPLTISRPGDWDGRINLPFLTRTGRFEIKAAG